MFFWGISWASGKIMSVYGSAGDVSFFRFALTFISLLVLMLLLREKLTIKRNGLVVLLIASVFISLYMWLFFKGLSLGKAGAGGVLVTTLNPIIAYAIMLFSNRRLPDRKEAIGLSLGLLAAIVLLKLWTNWESIFSSGNVYFLFATFSWAILSLFTARSSKYGSPVAFSLWMYGICSVFMLLLSSVDNIQSVLYRADIYFWGNLVFTAVFTTALATTFYFVGTTKIGAGKASSFIFLVPFSAALGGWVFLNEIPQWHTVIGGLSGVAAVYVLNRKKKS